MFGLLDTFSMSDDNCSFYKYGKYQKFLETNMQYGVVEESNTWRRQEALGKAPDEPANIHSPPTLHQLILEP